MTLRCRSLLQCDIGAHFQLNRGIYTCNNAVYHNRRFCFTRLAIKQKFFFRIEDVTTRDVEWKSKTGHGEHCGGSYGDKSKFSGPELELQNHNNTKLIFLPIRWRSHNISFPSAINRPTHVVFFIWLWLIGVIWDSLSGSTVLNQMNDTSER